MRAWWSDARNRRIAVVAVLLVAVVWTVTFLAAGGGGGEDGDTSPSTRRLEAGRAPSHDRPDAVWLFGFDTLRLVPSAPDRVSVLGFPAFGQVTGGPGEVLLYEPGSGRFGRLDATTNRIVDRATIPSRLRAGSDGVAEPVVAAAGSAAWLVTGPSTLTRHARPTGSAPDRTVELPGVGTRADTRVLAGPAGVVAISVDPTNETVPAVINRVDPGSGEVVATGEAGLPAGGLVDVAGGPGRVWLVGHTRLVPVDARTATAGPPLTLPPGMVARRMVDRGDQVWVLARDGRLARLDARDGRLLGTPTRPGYRSLGPTSRLEDGPGGPWALLATVTRGDYHAEVVRLGPTGRATWRLRLPDPLAIADLAVSTRR